MALRRGVLLLLSALLVVAVLGLQVSAQKAVSLTAANAVSLCAGDRCPPPREQRVGLLRFSGGLHLKSSSADFGGFSALRVGQYPAPNPCWCAEGVGWEAWWDEVNEIFYCFNPVTRESQWECPLQSAVQVPPQAPPRGSTTAPRPAVTTTPAPLGSFSVTCAHVPSSACECPQPNTGMRGTITDGAASSTTPYPRNAACKWLIAVPSGVNNGVIELTFTAFDTELDYDFVTISRCTTTQCSARGGMVQEVAKLSGNAVNLATVYSTGTTEYKFLQVEFKTDEEMSAHTGFVASWAIRVIIPVTTTPAPLGSFSVTCAHVPSSACECPQPTTGMRGTITDGAASSTTPYSRNAACKWLIAVPSGVNNGVIELTFTAFDTELDYDFVTISRCTTTQCSARGGMVQEVAKLSGNAVNLATVYSTGTTEYKFLQVEFKTDEEMSAHTGFVASWAIRVIIPVTTTPVPLGSFSVTCAHVPSSACECPQPNTGMRGTITDGAASSTTPYPRNAACKWLIAVPSGVNNGVIELTFTAFDTELDYDFVTISRCTTTQCSARGGMVQEVAKLSGKAVNLATVYSTGTTEYKFLQVEFKTDEEMSAHTGFVASWAIRVIIPVTTTPVPLGSFSVTCAHVPSSACECPQPTTGMRGTITDGAASSTTPYPRNAACKWLIAVPSGVNNGVIELTFTAFDTELDYDFVTISRCTTTQCSARGGMVQEVAKLSGKAVNLATVYSTGTTEYKFLQVEFKTDEEMSAHTGFVASWAIRVIIPVTTTPVPLGSFSVTCAHVPISACECPQPTTGMRGTITDGAASSTTPYPRNAACKWLIAVPSGVNNGVIELTFTAFDTELDYDFVTISRCTTTQCSARGGMVQEVAKLSGNAVNLATVYSTGTTEYKFLQVEFKTDEEMSAHTGFVASWAIRVIIPVTTTPVPLGSFSVTCAHVPSSACECPQPTTGMRGTITDGAASSTTPYPRNAACKWLIAVPSGVNNGVIELTFTAFDTELDYDFVTISRCTTTQCSARGGMVQEVAKLSGNAVNLATVYSTGTTEYKFLQVEFKTDEEMSAHTGFVASWAIRVIIPVTTTPVPRISAVSCAHVPISVCECAPPAVGAMSGTISDGSGPLPYPISATCKWLITAPPGFIGVISLFFDSFDTEEGYDFVTIRRCRTSQCSARGDAEQVARLSGNAVSSTTVYSTSTTEYKFLQVEFKTDEETSPNAGFVARWSISVPPPPPPPRPPLAAALTCPSGSSVCACSPSSGTSSGTISDGPSIYQPKSGISNCQWLIASTGSRFSLRFTAFDVETFSGDFGDYVDIRHCKTSACTARTGIQQIARVTGSAVSRTMSNILTAGAPGTPVELSYVYEAEMTAEWGFVQVVLMTDEVTEQAGFVADWWLSYPSGTRRGLRRQVVPTSFVPRASSSHLQRGLPFVSVNDKSMLLSGQLVHNGSGWLTGVEKLFMGQLLNTDGKPILDKTTGDAESLATTSNSDPMKGELLVGFEGSKATTRVLRYNVGAQGFAAVPVAQIGLAAGNARISMCAENGGPEAMDFLHNGALMLFCEEPIPAKPEFTACVDTASKNGSAVCASQRKMLVSPGWIMDQPSFNTFAYRINLLLSTAERPVAISRIPFWEGHGGDMAESRALRGGVLMLLRSWTQAKGNVLRLVYVDAATLTQAEVASKAARAKADTGDGGCVIEASLVAELSKREHNVDNFEGLAIVALPNFNVRVYLMSDDNFDIKTQRTLVLSFILDLKSLSSIPPPRCIGYNEAAVDTFLHPVSLKPKEDDGTAGKVIAVLLVIVLILGVAGFCYWMITTSKSEGEYSELDDKHVELWGTQSPADFVSPSKEEVVVREDPLPWGWNQYFDENGTAYYVDSASQRTQWERPAYVIEKWEEHNEGAAQYMLQEWEAARATAARVGQGEGDLV